MTYDTLHPDNEIEYQRQKELEDLKQRAEAAETRETKYREALKYYANENIYNISGPSRWYPVLEDSGTRARQALQE